jgi:hypothetical protein
MMTKKVRIENADTSDHKLVAQVWQKGAAMPDGMGGTNQAPDVMTSEHAINSPTDMVEVYVHSHQYLVVREVVPTDV